MPAGKQIKIPRKKTIAIVCFGSLNLSEKKKKLKIIMMVSEPKLDLGPDWKVKYFVSEAQNLLQKKRGFLNITDNKN